MAQPSELYVDPSIAGDSGAGTSGDPYGDLEYCIEQETFNTTNGTRVNIKAGTDEILAAQIETALLDTSVSIAWAATLAAPMIFQGYTTTAGDGGKGGITGSGARSILNAGGRDYVHFIDMHLHNTGGNIPINLDNDCSMVRCEVDNTTSDGVLLGLNATAIGNHVHNCSGIGMRYQTGYAAFNYFENGTNDFTNALQLLPSVGGFDAYAYRNIIKIDGTSDGILIAGPGVVLLNNAVWSNAGTGQGITVNAANLYAHAIMNNTVEGFSGTGGIGYDLATQSGFSVRVYAGNAAYDNETEYGAPSDYYLDYWKSVATTNETLSASPFADATNGDFSPVDTGSVKQGSLPQDFGDGQ